MGNYNIDVIIILMYC